MTLQRPGVQSLPPVVKPFVRSKANGKVFTLIRDDSGLGGSGYVFICRPQALGDNIRMTKEELIENFESFNEVLMVNDPRVARTDADLAQAIAFRQAAIKAKSDANVADATGSDPAAAEPAAAAPKKRGRPKGSKNKPKAPATE